MLLGHAYSREPEPQAQLQTACLKQHSGEGKAKPLHPFAKEHRFESHKCQTLLLA
jgi:hypothetical protein